ncbi:MAG: SufE family protein [Planctomycetota bacterium]
MPATLPPIDEIKDGFAFLDDWDDRFQYLIDLGKKVPKMDPADVTEDNRVHGCQSNVWLKLATRPPQNGTGPTVDVIANSDAHIVNGLIAVLLSLYDGLPVDQARAADALGLVKELGLDEHLSPTRRNGLHAMIQRIKALADAA